MTTPFKVLTMEDIVDETTPDSEDRLGTEYSRRITWVTDNADAPYLTLTSTAFTTARVVNNKGEHVREASALEDGDGNCDENLPVLWALDVDIHSENDANKIPEESLELFETIENEWVWHTNPEDVGGSEIRSERDIDDSIGYTFAVSIEASNKRCEDALAQESYFSNFAPENA